MTQKGVVSVRFLGDTQNLDRAFATVSKGAEETHGKLKGLGGGLAALGGGFALFDVAKEVATNFDALDHATHNLSQAMKDAGESAGSGFADKLKEAQDHSEKMGFSAAEATNSIAKLREAGVDTSRAMEAQASIMDLARAKNISYEDATKAVVMGMQGQGKALKELNVVLPAHIATTAQVTAAQVAYDKAVAAHGPASAQAVAAQKKLDEATASSSNRTAQLGQVLDIVNQKVGGQAASAADTLGGKLGALKEQGIGALTSALQGLMPVLTGIVSVFGFLGDHIEIVVPILGALTAAFVGINIAMGIQKAMAIEGAGAMAVFNAVMEANPLGLVVVAITAVAAGFVLMYNKVTWFRDLCNTVFAAIGVVIGGIVGVIKTVIGWFTGDGGLAGTVRGIGTVFSTVFGAITGFIGGVVNAIADIVTGIQNVITWLGKLGGVGSGKVTAGTFGPGMAGVFNAVTNMVNGGGGAGSNAAHHNAGGGRVRAGDWSIVGERRPEVFIPDVDGTIVPRVPSGMGGQPVQNFYLQTSADPYAIGHQILFLMRGRRA